MGKHTLYYIFLVLLCAGGLLLAISLAPNHTMQLWAMLFVAVSYCVGGILHHSLHHQVTFKIVSEYILVALFGLSLVYFITQVI